MRTFPTALQDPRLRDPRLSPEDLDPEAEAVALAGFDPTRVSYQALQRAELLWSAGEIPLGQFRTTVERLAEEEIATLLARQELMDYEDSRATNSRG